MKGVPFVQYLLPDGEQRKQWIERPAEIEEKAKAVVAAGGRFESEMLRTGEVSFEVVREVDGEPESVAAEICANGPDVLTAVDKLVGDAWKRLCAGRTQAATQEQEVANDPWADDYGERDSEVDAFGRIYHTCPGLDDEGDSAAPRGTAEREPGDHETRMQCARKDANLLSSLTDDGDHCPVIDFDVPVRLVGSSTTGNTHIYIDVGIPWDKFLAILDAFEAAGLVQKGYVDHARERGQAFVRPPWVKKARGKAPAPAAPAPVVPLPPDEDIPF